MNYYPIGTVVLLQQGEHPIMIYGRKQRKDDEPFVWDYVACLYPEGHISDDFSVFFQHEEIGEVLHFGLQNQMEEKMLSILQNV